VRKLPLLVERKAIVVPGDVLAEGNFKPGDYVVRIGNKLFATQIGLVEVKGNTVFVVPLRGKYIPRVGDLVIGTIVDYSLTSWKVDINSAYLATLPVDLAINKKFDIIKDELTRYFDIGDVIHAKIVAFSRVEMPILSTKDRGLGKLHGGMLYYIHPTRIPRLIGRKGSMINLIKKETGCKIKIGQNGVIWVSCINPEYEMIVVKCIRKIEREAHTEGLTDRIKMLITEEKNKLSQRGATDE